MPIMKITKANMNLMTPSPEDGKNQIDYYDTEVSCFGVRVTGKSKTFFVYRRIKGEPGKVFIAIGKFGLFTPEQARTVAKEYLRDMDMGRNPNPKYAVRLKIITIKNLLDEYLAKRKNLAESTRTTYNQWFKNHLAQWGNLDVSKVSGKMVVDRLETIEKSTGKTQAANVIKLLRSLYNYGLAVHPETITRNPVDSIKALGLWERPTRRKTFIGHDDLPVWYQSVLGCDNPAARDYLLFLLFTGVRKSEAVRLRWDDIDLNLKTYTFAPEKKHRGEDADRVTMPLSDQLWAILKNRKEKYYESEFVWPGRGGKPHIIKPDHWVKIIRDLSGIVFSCHYLRRNFCTVAESLDIPHYSLKALLNHSLGNDVTGGYVVMSADRLREPTQRVVNRIMEMVLAKPTPSADDVAVVYDI